MILSERTKKYIDEMSAIIVKSHYEIFNIDFDSLKAFINKQDVYKKRNGKTFTVEHHFGKWISFKKEDISYKVQNYTKYDNSVYGIEEIKGQKRVRYLQPAIKQRLINEYTKLL
jgi:hypothetical protein